MDWIRQADPSKQIIYNDFQNGAQEMRMLGQMQKDGKLPDAIGIQLHMVYRLLHNNAHVQGITWWDLSDKNSWKDAPRGWFRADGSPKPVVAAMSKLFAQWLGEGEDRNSIVDGQTRS
jgi:GH35 family endo-1,4-beta-xylanase